MKPFISRLKKEMRGVALVATLAILSLLTILLLTFVSITSSDRQSTHNYSQGMAADEIARSGLDQIVSQLQSELADKAKALRLTNSSVAASASFPIYRPLTNAMLGPERMSLLPSDPSLMTIVKISKPGAPFYTTPTVSGTNFASSALTTSNSLNGRDISLARWNRPLLVSGAATSRFPVPTWVLLGRNGPTVPSGTDLSSALGNNGAISGRYAYVVYDVSGLLDINAAGYPSGSIASAGNKGLTPWADLTQLTNTLTQLDVDNLVRWRNQATATSYSSYVTNWATNGFMQVAPGDTTFLNRQELIQYAQTKNPDLTNALPFLTTFSRELNGPTWGPSANFTAPYDYSSHQYLSTISGQTNNNVFILHPAVQSTFTRNNGIQALVGEPLVKYRFPLNELALIEKQGTISAALSGADQKEVAQYFGMDLVSDSTGLYRHWSYPTTKYASVYPHTAGRILTLDEVAALRPAREPDFFELLQAGILQGSLGLGNVRIDGLTIGANNYWHSTWTDPDANVSYQIIRIGANIIDQWTSDSCPTAITFNGFNFYGIEDLPYINALLLKSYAPGQTLTSALIPSIYLYFQFWNPHQLSTTSTRPTLFRVVPSTYDYYTLDVQMPANSTYPKTYWAWNKSTGAFLAGSTSQGSESVNPFPTFLSFTTPTDGSAFREPGLLTNSVFSPSSVMSPDLSTYGGWKRSSFRIFPTDVSSSARLPGSWNIKFNSEMTFLMQYSIDGGATYHTYSSFIGMEDYASGYRCGAFIGNGSGVASPDSMSFNKSDPRTWRFGPGANNNDTPSNAGFSLNPSSGTLTSLIANGPFAGPGDAGLSAGGVNASSSPPKPYRMDLWSVNDPAVTSIPDPHSNLSTTPGIYYQDTDTAYRPGDARYSYTAGNSPLYSGATANRPVVLNRPFRSVGELGYAFRDQPWKTLDLSSPNSADTALLDLFTLSGRSAMVAGRVNPNTPYPQVLAALISGATQNAGTSTTVQSANALAIAKGIVAVSSNAPFMNRADLAACLTNTAIANSFPSGIKTERESIVRALAESANTRTWNLLIDIIAQAGTYPSSARGLDDFMVNGQRRYWLSIAIDRYTGQVVDKRLESVNE